MPSPFRSAIAAVLVLSILAAACGDSSPSPTADAQDPVATTTTAAPPPTTAPAATDAPPSTAPPSTAPQTTTAPPRVPGPPPASYAEFRAQPTACGAAAPDPVVDMTFAAPEDEALAAGGPVTATIVTSCGDIVVELDPAAAPDTVNSFVFLARNGYFDGSASHRVVPGFVIQAGDPTATGRGGPGYVIADEFPADSTAYARGVIAMANAGPGTTGSQFFLVLADVPLPPQFSVFGRVTSGLEVMDRIAAVPLGFSPTGELSVPLETVYLERVEIAG